jgi:hypothetical protein
MRVLIIAICVTLAGCSIAADDISSIPKYVPPSPPTAGAQVKGLQKAISQELLVDPIQISDLRSASHGGPGAYFICLAGHRKDDSSVGYYSVFFENEVYQTARPAVILDLGERQAYRPADFPTQVPKSDIDNDGGQSR